MQVIDQSQSVFLLDELVIGATAGDSLYDNHGILLIAAGVEINEALIDKLRQRGVRTLYLDQTSPGPPRPAVVKKDNLRQRREPAAPSPQAGLSPNYSGKKVQRVQAQFAAGEKAVAYLCQAIKRSGTADLRRTDAHVEDYINELIDDPDPVIASALVYEADLELARRCVQFSILSMAIAQQMDLPQEQVRDLGSAALVHDWGLFELPVDSRFPHHPMSPQIRERYLRHPLTAVEILDMVQHVPVDLKLFVSQVHELMDGSGYPRRLTANGLHPCSRVLCVADAYLTMTSPPKGCPRIVPCDAVAYLIYGASQGKYSPKAVTGLLQAVTLYPLGSIVELSDTTKARVIRANGKDYGYPIVESLAETSRVINLKQSGLFVTRPIPSSEFHEVRLPETYKELNEAIASL